MRKKSLIAVPIALTLALAACSNAGNEPAGKGNNAEESSSPTNASNGNAAAVKPDPFGKYPEPVKFTTGIGTNAIQKFPAGNSYEDNHITRYLKDNYNIEQEILWSVPGENFGYRDRLNLAVASNELPDIFSVPEDINLVKKLVDNDMVEDLTQVYQDYASPTFKEFHSAADNRALDQVTFNGKLMAIPNLFNQDDQYNLVWVRQDWLDKLKLSPPKTMDDLMTIGKAFVEQDPDGNGKKDTIGLRTSDDPGRSRLVLNAMDAYQGMWIKDKDGKVVSGDIQPEMKNALGKLRELYANGVIHKEFAVMDDAKNDELLNNGKVGMIQWAWWAPYYPLNTVMQNIPDAVWKPYPILNAEGKLKSQGNAISSNWIMVRKGYEHPELAMKLVNITEEADLKKIPELTKLWETKIEDGGYDKYLPFSIGATSKYMDEIQRKYKELKDTADGKTQESALVGESVQIYDGIKKYKENPKDIGNWSIYTAWMEGAAVLANTPKEMVFPAYTQPTETSIAKGQTLDTNRKKAWISIVMGVKPLDYFDTWVEDWKKQGGEQMTKEVQEAIDALQ